jgi:peptidoglycan/LPS O-acetylase OafA/YrhL
VVLGVRNVLLVALFGWCVLRLVEEALAAWGRELAPVLADLAPASSAPSSPAAHSQVARRSS